MCRSFATEDTCTCSRRRYQDTSNRSDTGYSSNHRGHARLPRRHHCSNLTNRRTNTGWHTSSNHRTADRLPSFRRYNDGRILGTKRRTVKLIFRSCRNLNEEWKHMKVWNLPTVELALVVCMRHFVDSQVQSSSLYIWLSFFCGHE